MKEPTRTSSDVDSLYINKQSDITTDHGEGIAKNETELRQEEKSEKSSSCNSDGIYEGNEDSSHDDSLYVNKQSDITIDHEEGTAKNETELRQEDLEKSEKSSSCNSDGIYEGNEDSSHDDSLYVNKQSDITIDHEEGTAKNETELRQEDL
eukprot:723293_1